MPSTAIESNHDNWRLQIRHACHMVTQYGGHSPSHLTGSYADYFPIRGCVEGRLRSVRVTLDMQKLHVCPILDVAVDFVIEHRSLHDAGKVYWLWVLLLHRIFRILDRKGELKCGTNGECEIEGSMRRLLHGRNAVKLTHAALH